MGPTKEYGHHPINIISDEQNVLIFESRPEVYVQGQVGTRRWVLLNVRTGQVKEITPESRVFVEEMYLVNNKLIWRESGGITVMDLQTGLKTSKDIAKNKNRTFSIHSLINDQLYWSEWDLLSPTRYYRINVKELM